MSAHIFIDADNIKPEVGFKAIKKFSVDYSIEQVDIVGNETTLSNKYLEASDIYNIRNCFYGKNSADTWLCTEIAKTIFENPKVDTIIIVSSDRDFLAAIKLVTDQKRKVILVSDGNGHKNLKALLYDLRINPDLIELVDFKTGLTIPENIIPKEGKNTSMEIFSPNPNVNKVRELRKKLTPHMQTFFTKHENEFNFISIRHAGKLIEIPFIDGINISTFTNILIALKIIDDGKIIQKIIDDNALKLDDKKIYKVEEKILEQKKVTKPKKIPEPVKTPETAEIPESEKTPFNDVVTYFSAHAANAKNIFIKSEGKIHEVPFVSGISLSMFSRLLKGYAIADDADKIKKIIADSFLDLRDNKIYFHSEEKISAELKPYLKKIPSDALEVIKQNEDKLKIVSIAHNDTVYKVPFVEGIHLSIFAHMLRHLKIIGKNASSQKVLAANGFTVKNNLVFKK